MLIVLSLLDFVVVGLTKMRDPYAGAPSPASAPLRALPSAQELAVFAEGGCHLLTPSLNQSHRFWSRAGMGLKMEQSEFFPKTFPVRTKKSVCLGPPGRQLPSL